MPVVKDPVMGKHFKKLYRKHKNDRHDEDGRFIGRSRTVRVFANHGRISPEALSDYPDFLKAKVAKIEWAMVKKGWLPRCATTVKMWEDPFEREPFTDFKHFSIVFRGIFVGTKRVHIILRDKNHKKNQKAMYSKNLYAEIFNSSFKKSKPQGKWVFSAAHNEKGTQCPTQWKRRNSIRRKQSLTASNGRIGTNRRKKPRSQSTFKRR